MLANCCMRRCQREGTMGAIWQWRPPWLECVFLPSFCLANCISDVPQLQNHPKLPLSYLISPSIMVRWGQFKYPSCAHARSKDTWAMWMKYSFILGAAVPGEASETMVELCFWPSIVLVRKVAIYCEYLVHSMYDRFLCTRAIKEGKNVKPTVIPSKSHSASVFIPTFVSILNSIIDFLF